MTTAPVSRALTLGESCKVIEREYGLAVNPSTLWRWHRFGVSINKAKHYLPTYRVGVRVLVREDALKNFMQQLNDVPAGEMAGSAA